MSAAAPPPDGYLYMARVAEQAERYDDMVTFMTLHAASATSLSRDERTLLSCAYKNAAGARRSAWRVAAAADHSPPPTPATASAVKKYREKIEAELEGVCGGVLGLIDKRLLPGASGADAKTFYLKMKGDYYRYLAEVKVGSERKIAAERTLEAYLAAQEIAVAQLAPTDPLRLGLALNFSVFYYEILNSPERACTLAKQSFDDAMAVLVSAPEDMYRDSTLIMQLIRDNLTLWTSDMQEDGSDDNREAKPDDMNIG